LWLVSFLKEWCSGEDLARKAYLHMALAESGELNQRGGYYMAEALAQSLRDPELRYEIVACTKAHLAKTDPELAGDMSDTCIMALEAATSAYQNGDVKKAEKYFQIAADEGESRAMTNLGVLCETEYKDYEQAEKYYLMAVEKDELKAMRNLGHLYQTEYKDFGKAEKYYLMAVEEDEPLAMIYLGDLYETEYKDFEKAEKYYLMAAEKDDFRPWLEYTLSLLYDKHLQDPVKAKRSFGRAVEHDFDDHMMFLLRVSLDDDEIRKAFFQLFEKYASKEDYSYLLALSIILIHNGDFKKAINVFMDFLNAIEKSADFQQHISNFLILLMARKQFHLAHQLFENERYQLKEKIKPVYFALMKLMHEEHPKEFKRMGAEVGETVGEVLAKIDALKKTQ